MSQFTSIQTGSNNMVVIDHPITAGIHYQVGPDSKMVWCPAQLPESHPSYRKDCYICFMAENSHDPMTRRDLMVNRRGMWPVYRLAGVRAKAPFGQQWLSAGRRLSEDLERFLQGRPSKALNIVRSGAGLRTEYTVYRYFGWMPKFWRDHEDWPEMPIISNAEMAKLFTEDPETLELPSWLYGEEEVA